MVFVRSGENTIYTQDFLIILTICFDWLAMNFTKVLRWFHQLFLELQSNVNWVFNHIDVSQIHVIRLISLKTLAPMTDLFIHVFQIVKSFFPRFYDFRPIPVSIHISYLWSGCSLNCGMNRFLERKLWHAVFGWKVILSSAHARFDHI